ncbi:hypothetical protein BDZ45DRAFT_593888 [Acephala macrosclerotiorum]|nr:hypothetical protein BDZ45DRAFT_593888 [Acephala macrosclerotiorum]
MGTLLSFQDEIPPDACSKTFTDTISIATEMDIDYLWIDWLCVIRDSLEDWLKEGSSVASLYGGSLLNIAAASASDGSHGCFFDRKKSWRCQFLAGHGRDTTFYDCVPACPYAITADLPLETRGWTLQERILAPRTVQFTKKEAYWECFEKIACEVFPAGIPSELLAEQNRDVLKKELSVFRLVAVDHGPVLSTKFDLWQGQACRDIRHCASSRIRR